MTLDEMMNKKQEKLGGLSFQECINKQKAMPVKLLIFCGECNGHISNDGYNYCPWCGRRIEWKL